MTILASGKWLDICVKSPSAVWHSPPVPAHVDATVIYGLSPLISWHRAGLHSWISSCNLSPLCSTRSQRSMTITYNTAPLRDTVNTLSISFRVTERGERLPGAKHQWRRTITQTINILFTPASISYESPQNGEKKTPAFKAYWNICGKLRSHHHTSNHHIHFFVANNK